MFPYEVGGVVTRLKYIIPFVLHYPLIMLIPSHIWKQSFFAPFVLIPAIIFLIVAFYLFLRKFFPACLPYVANDRITHVPKKN